MTNIDQNRFALMAVLTDAHKARPDEYPDPQTLIAMSDEVLRAYAFGLIALLEAAREDTVASELHSDLRRILHATP
jgi:hypothetical protein